MPADAQDFIQKAIQASKVAAAPAAQRALVEEPILSAAAAARKARSTAKKAIEEVRAAEANLKEKKAALHEAADEVVRADRLQQEAVAKVQADVATGPVPTSTPQLDLSALLRGEAPNFVDGDMLQLPE